MTQIRNFIKNFQRKGFKASFKFYKIYDNFKIKISWFVGSSAGSTLCWTASTARCEAVLQSLTHTTPSSSTGNAQVKALSTSATIDVAVS